MSTPLDLLQQGFHLSVVAATLLVETLQDPQKRRQTFTEIQSQVSEQTKIWTEKGSQTEAEARRYVEAWLAQRQNKTPSSGTNVGAPGAVSYGQAQRELEELVAQITALKAELEQNRNQP